MGQARRKKTLEGEPWRNEIRSQAPRQIRPSGWYNSGWWGPGVPVIFAICLGLVPGVVGFILALIFLAVLVAAASAAEEKEARELNSFAQHPAMRMAREPKAVLSEYSAGITSSRSSKFPSLIVLAVLSAAFIHFAWPSSAWMLAFSGVSLGLWRASAPNLKVKGKSVFEVAQELRTYTFSKLPNDRSAEPPDPNHEASAKATFISVFVTAAIKELRGACTAITSGLFLVCIIQVVLTLFVDISGYSVSSYESFLLATSKSLKSYCDRPTIVIALTFLALSLSLSLPKTMAVRRLTAIRQWIGWAMVTLAVVTSFTFFASRGIIDWRQNTITSTKPQLSRDLDRIAKFRRKIVAEAVVQKQFEDLTTKDKMLLEALFRRVQSNPRSREIVSRYGKAVGTLFLDPKSSGSSQPEGQETKFVQAQKWVSSESAPPPSELTLADIEVFHVQAQKLERRAEEAREAAAETVKAALGDLLPNSLGSLVQPFVDALFGSVIDASELEFLPPEVNSIQEARVHFNENVEAAPFPPAIFDEHAYGASTPTARAAQIIHEEERSLDAALKPPVPLDDPGWKNPDFFYKREPPEPRHIPEAPRVTRVPEVPYI